jgi:hypothetical protein
MKVRDIMTASVDSIESADTIAYAARRMAEDDIGALPVLSCVKGSMSWSVKSLDWRLATGFLVVCFVSMMLLLSGVARPYGDRFHGVIRNSPDRLIFTPATGAQ